MDLKGLAGATGAGGTFAVSADVLVNGGEVVLWLVGFLVDQGPLIYLLLARLTTLAPEVSWLPADRIQTAFLVVAAVVFVLALYRLVNNFVMAWRSRNAQ